MKHFTAILLSLLSLLALLPRAHAAADAPSPNVIIIFCDDLGYGDLGCYGSQKNRTPNIDKLATEGMRFTDFYSSSPVCTPSRASLLTGCYPRRVGMHEDATGHWVLIPRSRRGLHPDELTLAEGFKSKKYATACIGKWHLGDQPPHLPIHHGFDYYYGIPYSNDMQSKKRGDPPLPLVEMDKVIEAPADQSTLTKRYTRKAIEFIEKNHKQPFFLYLPHTFPHLPLFASPEFKGKSANGRYGDSVEEIDWSTGEILKCLERLKLVENTFVIFTSDNGSNGRNGGSNAPLAGAKGSTMEGGMRVPMIARWPGRIAAGSTCTELSTTLDVLPTFGKIVGYEIPTSRIDGFDISPLLFEKGKKTPYEAFFYYRRRQLQAVRHGDWKYHLPLEETHPNWTSPEPTGKGRPGKLINLANDLQERTDVSTENPEVVKLMQIYADYAVSRYGNDGGWGVSMRLPLTLTESRPMLLGGYPEKAESPESEGKEEKREKEEKEESKPK